MEGDTLSEKSKSAIFIYAARSSGCQSLKERIRFLRTKFFLLRVDTMLEGFNRPVGLTVRKIVSFVKMVVKHDLSPYISKHKFH